jgi:hypothetical protein
VVLVLPFIVSMSPPGYPSAWLRPRRARFRFARQDHCSSTTPCGFHFRYKAVIQALTVSEYPTRHDQSVIFLRVLYPVLASQSGKDAWNVPLILPIGISETVNEFALLKHQH